MVLEETVGDGDQANGDFVPASETDDTTTSQGAGSGRQEPSAGDDDPEPAEAATLTEAEKQVWNNLPPELRKGLNRVFTQKSQKIAKHSRVIEALETNPAAFIRAAARELGLQITESESSRGPQRQTPEGPDSELSEIFGEEAARKLTPFIEKKAREIARGEIDPVAREVDRQMAEKAAEESRNAIANFGEKYPGWEKHEQAMLKLAQKIDPKGLTDVEFMELLYHQVTRDGKEGDETKRVIDRLARSAASIEPRKNGVPQSRVSTQPANPARMSLKEAFAMAKRGELVED